MTFSRSSRWKAVFYAGIIVFSLSSSSFGEDRFTFEAFLGGDRNFDSTLTIHQDGQPDIGLEASWETRPFEAPLYYSLRFGFLRNWEAQLTHHKIF